MSSALERLGRFADCAVRRDLEDPFEAPGLDSHRGHRPARAQAGSAEVGLVRTSSSPSGPRDEPLRLPGRAVRRRADPGGRGDTAEGPGHDTSGRRPLFEQPDDFLDYLTDVVMPSTAQLPRS